MEEVLKSREDYMCRRNDDKSGGINVRYENRVVNVGAPDLGKN